MSKLIDHEYKVKVKKYIHLSTLRTAIKFSKYLINNHIDLLWFEEDQSIVEDYLRILEGLLKIKEEN